MKMENKLVKIIIKNLSKIEVVDNVGYKIPTKSGQVFIHHKDLNDLVKVYLDQDGEGKLSWTLNTKNSKKIKTIILEKFIKNEPSKLEDFLKREREVKQLRLNQKFIQTLEDKIKSLPNGKGCIYKTTRKDFKKQLSSSVGFGSNDLVESRISGYTYLLKTYGTSLKVNPISIGSLELEWIIQ